MPDNWKREDFTFLKLDPEITSKVLKDSGVNQSSYTFSFFPAVGAMLSIGSSLSFGLVLLTQILGLTIGSYVLISMGLFTVTFLLFAFELYGDSPLKRLHDLFKGVLAFGGALYAIAGLILWIMGGVFTSTAVLMSWDSLEGGAKLWGVTTALIFLVGFAGIYAVWAAINFVFKVRDDMLFDDMSLLNDGLGGMVEWQATLTGAIIILGMNINRILWYGAAFGLFEATMLQ